MPEGNLLLTGQHIKKQRVGNWYKYGENGVLQNITIYGFQGHEIQNIQFNESSLKVVFLRSMYLVYFW